MNGAAPTRWPWQLLALPALALAQCLSGAAGVGLYLRLAAATLCRWQSPWRARRARFRPAERVRRAFVEPRRPDGGLGGHVRGRRAVVVGRPLCRSRRRRAPVRDLEPLRAPSPVAIGVGLAGVGFGIALWAIAGQLDGDALFHLARIRKLEAFDNLTLDSVNEFADGGLHPGYAFPVWHVLIAGVAGGRRSFSTNRACSARRVSVAYEAGVAILRTVWAGIAVLLASVALTALAPEAAARMPRFRYLPPRRATCSPRRPSPRSSSSCGSRAGRPA